jgi:hypothetical protein
MYQFPETNKFRAREVLELDFDIREQDRARELYVELDEARGDAYREELLYLLSIDEDELKAGSDRHVKVIFSGHRGCGKSLELYRIHQYLNNPDRYVSLFIDMERELEIAHFQPEDFFVTIIVWLIDLVKKQELEVDLKPLNTLAEDWLNEDHEVRKEWKEEQGEAASVEAKAGLGFWDWLSFNVGIKSFFTGISKISRTLRQQIRKEPLKLQAQLNSLIEQVRKEVVQKGKGRDLLLVFDGTEKIRYEIYKNLFVQDSFLIRELKVNLICAVPINAFYDIQTGVTSDAYERVVLPMFKITDDNAHLFKDIISKRVDLEAFFAAEALDIIVHYSGGCPRQLLKIASTALRKALGKKVEKQHAEAAIHLLGQEMFERLEKAHVEIIQQQAFEHADEDIKELLFSLAVLKYNGKRKTNPLLNEFIPADER